MILCTYSVPDPTMTESSSETFHSAAWHRISGVYLGLSLCSSSAVLTLILVSELKEASGPLQGWHGCGGLCSKEGGAPQS